MTDRSRKLPSSGGMIEPIDEKKKYCRSPLAIGNTPNTGVSSEVYVAIFRRKFGCIRNWPNGRQHKRSYVFLLEALNPFTMHQRANSKQKKNK